MDLALSFRTAYEREKRFTEAGDFFIGEMEAMRYRPLSNGKRLKEWRDELARTYSKLVKQETKGGDTRSSLVKSRFRRYSLELQMLLFRALAQLRLSVGSALWWYWLLGLYGESYARPILWSLLTAFSFALIRQHLPQSWLGETVVSTNYLDNLSQSFPAFFQAEEPVGNNGCHRTHPRNPPLGPYIHRVQRRFERRPSGPE